MCVLCMYVAYVCCVCGAHLAGAFGMMICNKRLAGELSRDGTSDMFSSLAFVCVRAFVYVLVVVYVWCVWRAFGGLAGERSSNGTSGVFSSKAHVRACVYVCLL